MKNILLTMILGALIVSESSAQLIRTRVQQGDIEGVEEQGIAHYKGIPFAQPPVGELRWKAPQPAAPWQGVYKADTFKARPYQQMQGPAKPGDPGVSEDCLYLNVLTPAKSADEALPVLVWIHGGGFNTGSSWDDNGDNFAKAGIVYVSIEYRTNVFGFLSLPALSAESKRETGREMSGNYGLMDQLLALQWVHDNIVAFGGDASKVTIMGESAGAISVSMLCQSPLAKGLFRGAISQSGGNMTSLSDQRIDNNTMRTLQGSEAYGTALLERLGLAKKKLKELRKLDPVVFMNDSAAFSAGGSLWPYYDDYVLSADAYRQYLDGNYNDVNVLIGTNSDEGSMFTSFLGEYSVARYEAELLQSFPDEAWRNRFSTMYPGTTWQEAFDAHSDIFRESGFAWPTYAWGNIQSGRTAKGLGQGKVFMYFFDQERSNFFRQGQSSDRKALTMHAADLSYTFGHSHYGSLQSPEDQAMSRLMMQYWINFVKTGDPNGGYLPHWPTYQQGTESVMYFRDGAHLAPVQNQQQLDLWQEYNEATRSLSGN